MAYLNAAPQSVRTDTSTAGPATPPAGDTKKKPQPTVTMSYQQGFATAA
ncbi:MAG: hypothetical protein QNI90_17575 [Dinoroseobacter sp.]|nr:hypothetical protein [Dinoroseobacter sp.]